MSHGQDPRPLESTDGTQVTVKPSGSGNTVVYVSDPEVREHLGAIRNLLEDISLRLQMISGG